MKRTLVTAIILAILFGGVAFAVIQRHENMMANHTLALNELLEQIYAMDTDPPQTPEEVITYALAILTALNGDLITEDGLFAGIITRHRQLLGSELLEANSFEVQYAHFRSQLEERRDDGIYQIEIRVVDLFELADYEGIATAHVAQYFEGLGMVHWRYNLEYEAGLGWRIQSWETADVNFRVIEM